MHFRRRTSIDRNNNDGRYSAGHRLCTPSHDIGDTFFVIRSNAKRKTRKCSLRSHNHLVAITTFALQIGPVVIGGGSGGIGVVVVVGPIIQPGAHSHLLGECVCPKTNTNDAAPCLRSCQRQRSAMHRCTRVHVDFIPAAGPGGRHHLRADHACVMIIVRNASERLPRVYAWRLGRKRRRRCVLTMMIP